MSSAARLSSQVAGCGRPLSGSGCRLAVVTVSFVLAVPLQTSMGNEARGGGAIKKKRVAPPSHEAEPNSQNGNPSKINPEKVACFSNPETDRQLPSFHQQSTTNSPPKHHVQPPVFAKTPSKNKVP